MRYLIESLEKSYLHSVGGIKLDSRSKETNPLGQIFGGYIRTEVTCLKCKHTSTTFQHFQVYRYSPKEFSLVLGFSQIEVSIHILVDWVLSNYLILRRPIM